jgi:hypothetical protein
MTEMSKSEMTGSHKVAGIIPLDKDRKTEILPWGVLMHGVHDR